MSLRFDETTILMGKCNFLSNTKNKENFVYLLGRHLQVKGYNVQPANADADVEIVNCAISKLGFDNVLVTADDTDILIFMMHYYMSDLKRKQ